MARPGMETTYVRYGTVLACVRPSNRTRTSTVLVASYEAIYGIWVPYRTVVARGGHARAEQIQSVTVQYEYYGTVPLLTRFGRAETY